MLFLFASLHTAKNDAGKSFKCSINGAHSFFLTLSLVPKLFAKALCPAGQGFQATLGLQSQCCGALSCQAVQGHTEISSPRVCSASTPLRPFSCSTATGSIVRHCSTAGSSTADVLFSAKYDHLQVCAGVSIFISHYSSPAGFPLKLVPSC